MKRIGTLASGGAVVLIGAVALSGCSGGGKGTNGVATAGGTAKPSASASPSVSAEEASLKFAQCMRAHGVDMPDPETNGRGGVSIMIRGGASPQVVQRAQKACEKYMPRLGRSGPGKLDAAAQDRALKFAQCMRDHGVDMPDPDFSGGGVRIRANGGGKNTLGQGPNPNDPTFQKAIKACRSLLGGDGGFSLSTGPK